MVPVGADFAVMPVQRHEHVTEMARAAETSPPPSSGGLTGWEAAWDMAGLTVSHIPPEGREGVVRARLSTLLASLGEFPAPRDLAGVEANDAVSGLLDDICPAGSVVMHGRSLPALGVKLENLVVASRGAVVVSPVLAPLPGRGRSGTRRAPAVQAGRGISRSTVVRETLRRAHALQAWLSGTRWAGTPVIAAVCSEPAPASVGEPPLVIGELWLGAIASLPGWLGSGDVLGGTGAAALGYFLAAELPALP
jgi:hypothetical protein